MNAHSNDQEFMQLAIEEMLKSCSEHTAKVDPLVGAVLVSSEGEILGKRCTGFES